MLLAESQVAPARAASFFLLMLASCSMPLSGSVRPASTPIAFAASSATARVVFVRPETFIGSAVSAFYFDTLRNQPLGKSVNNTYFALELEPGDYELCWAPVFEMSNVQYSAEQLRAWGVPMAPTRTVFEAGTTYVFHVTAEWGPKFKAHLVPPGSELERELIELLPAIRPTEPKIDSAEYRLFSGKHLREWRDACLDH